MSKYNYFLTKTKQKCCSPRVTQTKPKKSFQKILRSKFIYYDANFFKKSLRSEKENQTIITLNLCANKSPYAFS